MKDCPGIKCYKKLDDQQVHLKLKWKCFENVEGVVACWTRTELAAFCIQIAKPSHDQKLINWL